MNKEKTVMWNIDETGWLDENGKVLYAVSEFGRGNKNKKSVLATLD